MYDLKTIEKINEPKTYTIHDKAVCKRDVSSSRYHNKSWSSNFVCPVCGRTGRFNLNFLGQRNVVCDGKKFYKVAR